MTALITSELVATLVVLTIMMVLLIYFRPSLVRTPGGKLLAFISLCLLPLASMRSGFLLHFESTKTTAFCLSCHVMEPYGESLLVDDQEYVPAVHFQNGTLDRKKACFTCHTQYTMFGDMRAKMAGLQHLYVYYLGEIPEEIELYSPYSNRECLYCHGGGRQYEDLHEHDTPTLVTNERSCQECHEKIHDAAGAHAAPKWRGTVDEILELSP